MDFSTSLLRDLDARGFIYQCTDPTCLDELFENCDNLTFYLGFDPTCKSLHVGHIPWIKLVNKLQAAGASPIIVAGGATGMIGDPTWKDSERVMLGRDSITENTKSILSKLKSLIKFDGCKKNKAVLFNNYDWLSHINYIDFIRDFGPLFSVNKMLAMDSVSARLERQQHLSFLEFNYMLLQAYDFWHLSESHGCSLQIGGADQWSNMLAGADLIKRKSGRQVSVMTLPLLTTSSGKKMGKTENGAVWLDSSITSHFDFWQYWRNVDDRDVVKLLKLFTNIDIAEINSASKLVGTEKINEWKVRLADEVTSFVHPDSNIEGIKSGASGRLNDGDYQTFKIERAMQIDEALVIVQLAESKSAARRLIDGNGVKVDGKCVIDCRYTICQDAVVSVGKKRYVKIEFIGK
jgi:tyrosyl-tRNA synthetase